MRKEGRMRSKLSILSLIGLALVVLPFKTYAHGPSYADLVFMIDTLCSTCPVTYKELSDDLNRKCADWNETNSTSLLKIRKGEEYQDAGKDPAKVLAKFSLGNITQRDCEDINNVLSAPTIAEILEIAKETKDPSTSLTQNDRPKESPSTQSSVKLTRSPNIICDLGSLTVNGILFRKPYTKSSLRNAFGAQSRSLSKPASEIETWDLIGVHAYADHGSDTFSTIAISFEPQNYDYFPKQPFSGNLSIKGNLILPNTSGKDLEIFGFIRDKEFHYGYYELNLGSIRISVEFSKGLSSTIQIVRIKLGT
jgi:hypothetical protein